MERKPLSTTTRWIILVLGVTNIFSFALGVALAGVGTQRDADLSTRLERAAAAVRTTQAPRAVGSPAKAASGVKKVEPAAARQEDRARVAATLKGMPIKGKGMWIYQFNKIARGDPKRIVRAAVDRGLSHIYVRAGSSKAGLHGLRDIARILPVAHAAGLKVIAWDFPYLHNPGADVRRARVVLNLSVQGHSIDGFAADIETPAEGTRLTRARASKYAQWLRVGSPDKFLILVPPRPNKYTTSFYPYDLLVPRFDAVAPMVYWGRQRAADATDWALRYLNRFGKPVAPIGQAFDMGPEGGPKGHPKGRALVAFMNHAKTYGAVGVSFWSWQHTPRGLWHTIDTYDWPEAKHAG